MRVGGQKEGASLAGPGDRRDAHGTVWLATPRPDTISGRADVATPFRFTVLDGFGQYRRNAGLLAARIIGAADPELRVKLAEYQEGLRRKVEEKAARLEALRTEHDLNCPENRQDKIWDGHSNQDSY